MHHIAVVIVFCLAASLALAQDQEGRQRVPPELPSASIPLVTQASMFEYICRGEDPRVLGKFGAVLQQTFSAPFAWLHVGPPIHLHFGDQMVVPFPPFVALNFKRTNGNWRTIRFGWRWDQNCGRYIADVILKLDFPTPLYY